MKIFDELIARCRRVATGPIPTLDLSPKPAPAGGAPPFQLDVAAKGEEARLAQQLLEHAALLLECHRAIQAISFALGAAPSIHHERFQRDLQAIAQVLWNAKGETPPTIQALLKLHEAGVEAFRAEARAPDRSSSRSSL
jgi:hypothetical protein